MGIRPAVMDGARGIAGVYIEAWRTVCRGLVPVDGLDNVDLDRRS